MLLVSGGCLALNSIYREVRESSEAVKVWYLELLHALLTCMALADSDDPALPTHSLANTALAHLIKIITHYKDALNEVR